MRIIAATGKQPGNVILSEAKLNEADEVREVRLSISDQLAPDRGFAPGCFASLELTSDLEMNSSHAS